MLSVVSIVLVVSSFAAISPSEAFPLSGAAWSESQWEQRCKDIRTTYNPTSPLNMQALTLKEDDPRFLDFLYWVWANKILEHQVEQVGGTEWNGPKNGVIFYWAPGSHWETHTIASFEHAVHHIAAEHGWKDTMFKDFFEKFGGVKNVNLRQRLTFEKSPTWTQFLQHIGGSESAYYRYVFHQESGIDPRRQAVTLFGGQGVVFEYTFDRYVVEIQEVVTDCKAFQFFELYDRYGKGFASNPGWAGQAIPKR